MLRLDSKIFLASALLLASLLASVPTVHSAGTSISTVYVSPSSTCCSSNIPYTPGQTFSVSVDVSLASGEYLSSFDVRINYTNYHSSYLQGVLQPTSIDYSTNIFSSYQANGQTAVPSECINGISVLLSGSGCSADTIGQVRLTESLLGQAKLAGPLTGELFRITFDVTGYGSSALIPDIVSIVNPTPDPSNPQDINPQFIPTLAKGGVFGNQGVVAFFDFQPSDASISPAVIPNNPVSFDANASFVPYNTSIPIETYSWNFGDGSAAQNITGSASNIHTFTQSGNYTVTLRVWDSKNEMNQTSRVVPVVPALGNLALTIRDQSGTTVNGGVQVSLFNTSSSPTPFATRSINAIGGVSFNGLTPDTYQVKLSGPGFLASSKSEKVIPGWTTTDTIRLAPAPSAANYSGLIYTVGIAVAVAVFFVAIILQRRRHETKMNKGQVYSKTKSKGGAGTRRSA